MAEQAEKNTPATAEPKKPRPTLRGRFRVTLKKGSPLVDPKIGFLQDPTNRNVRLKPGRTVVVEELNDWMQGLEESGAILVVQM